MHFGRRRTWVIAAVLFVCGTLGPGVAAGGIEVCDQQKVHPTLARRASIAVS